MDREKLKEVAGHYFKDQMGMEPDMFEFTCENDEQWEYNLRVTAGYRKFDIRMLPMANRICLTEIKHEGTFTDATQLAGYDCCFRKL